MEQGIRHRLAPPLFQTEHKHYVLHDRLLLAPLSHIRFRLTWRAGILKAKAWEVCIHGVDSKGNGRPRAEVTAQDLALHLRSGAFLMTHAHEATSPGLGDEVKPHKIHRFSWQEQEQELNSRVPQFRTAFYFTAVDAPIRVHFIHVRSQQDGAIPLLLIPPFPFTNLSLAHIIDLFTKPKDGSGKRYFHLVIPSLPGLGFSDALPDRMPMIASMAYMLNVVMKRLDYEHFLVTTSAPSGSVLSPLDWMVANHIASACPDSCLGVHLLSPPLRPPGFREAPVNWAKWKAVQLLGVPMPGYSRADVKAVKRVGASISKRGASTHQAPLGFGFEGAYEPNTLAYALCDSPVGLLLFLLMVLRISDPAKGLPPREIIRLAALMWLPGPEGMMRLWAQCASTRYNAARMPHKRPKASITIFEHEDTARSEPWIAVSLPRPTPTPCTCPAWASQQYRVLDLRRIKGKPGLLIWERPQIILEGVRGLAEAIAATDGRLAASGATERTSLDPEMTTSAQRVERQSPESTQQSIPETPQQGGCGTDEQHRESAEEPILDSARREARARAAETRSPKEQPGRETGQVKGNQSSDSDEFSEEESPNTVIAVPIGT
ncbi:hypothetical protein HIM_08837 [Hirsutella minnesotensis 3608]|uniref:Epoxide hydrolase N-terminal domain-containing protein n=1 Tax=Hirsutella minnesotensis 3608 TaxID=1043627 RepID=A0A0F7ZY29_9HYPO|nr:hypothetical protein HIM_08837 [Hirsutella minnesotensis 3608]